MLADGLTDREHMAFVETHLERGAAVARGAECAPLRRDRGVRPLTVVGRNQPRHVHERCGRRRLPGEGVDLGAQAVASAALFSAMRFRSSAHDLTKDCAPSTCNCAASASMSIPAFAKAARTFSASPPSLAMTDFTAPPAANANKVFSGMVSMVSGAARASTYNPAAAFGSLVPVLAQSMRCLRAPLASRSSQRLLATNSQCAR